MITDENQIREMFTRYKSGEHHPVRSGIYWVETGTIDKQTVKVGWEMDPERLLVDGYCIQTEHGTVPLDPDEDLMPFEDVAYVCWVEIM